MKTWFETKYDEGYEKGKDYGLEKGMEKGTETTYRVVLRELLENRFGPLPYTLGQRLEQTALVDLKSLFQRACSAKSLAELGLVSNIPE
jgi:hypothetical protein